MASTGGNLAEHHRHHLKVAKDSKSNIVTDRVPHIWDESGQLWAAQSTYLDIAASILASGFEPCDT
jgi:hypothetical protein